jgi:hypothetical protein
MTDQLDVLRRALMDEITTLRLVVGDGHAGPLITIEADASRAAIEIRSSPATSQPTSGVSIVVSRGEGDTYAGVQLERRGDTVVELLATAPADGSEGRCRLVFDDPRSDAPWLIVDVNGGAS